MKTTSDKSNRAIQELMGLVFEKAGEESNEKTGYGLSSYLERTFGEKIKERTLIRYYDGYVRGIMRERKRPNKINLNVLSEYIGYKDYNDYLRRDVAKRRIKKCRTCLMLSLSTNSVLLAGLIFFVYHYYQKNCMLWVEDHYERARCSGLSNETVLNKNAIDSMRRIYPCDTTTFFKDSNPMLWYDRSGNRITFFNFCGKHPTNGKTLKPITQDIIDAYIEPCESME
ncbi:MAG: hypothetical protein AAGB24_03990 [Bacteroidota bacterium]